MSMMPNAEELKTLKDQGDEEAAKQKILDEEKTGFENLNKALSNHEIKKGLRLHEVSGRFGKPAAVDRFEKGGRWLYKVPDAKKWLEVPRVWIYFDAHERVTGIECAHMECEKIS